MTPQESDRRRLRTSDSCYNLSVDEDNITDLGIDIERLNNPLLNDVRFNGSVGSPENDPVPNSAAGQPCTILAHYHYRTHHRTSPSNPYTLYSSTFTGL